MRWGTLWLTAVMIAAASAVYSPRVITLENMPASIKAVRVGSTASTTEVEEPTTLETTTCNDNANECDQSPISSGTGEDPTTPNEDLIVTTNSGDVQGFLWQDKNDIISYIDIPYGTVKTAPFEAATAAEQWKEMHKVRKHVKRCPQIHDNEYVGNIDCLTLSIFKPRIAEKASVFFYIHGDDFKTGSGDPSIYGPDYLVSNKIILVLPNYRLGPLGFLCMKNETAPGNMALKDLTLALSWIHDNIHFFGGNPDNIVVSGDGRSGALAELLALSPMSKDHVEKVISESGSLLSHWALDRDPESTVADFFDRIQEAEKSIESRIDMSLGNLDLSTILKAVNDIEFKPCIEAKDDNVFMTETPYAMITNNKIETKFLMGSAMYAGLQEALHHTQDSINDLNEDFTLLLPNDLKFATSTLKAQIGGRVKRQYFGDHDITLENVQSISLYYTDVRYLSPGIRSARLLAKAGATVYFYEFSFVGEFNRELDSLNSIVQGAARGDIVQYLFTRDGHVPDAENTDKRKMVATLTEMWTNFMKEGHPATETIEWNKFENMNHDEEEWLLIDSDQPCMQKGLHVDRLPLWTNIYEEHFIEEYFIDEPNEDLIVTTNSGKVQGFSWQKKEDIISYIDIPYGTVNTKPFEAATPAEPWDVHGVRDHDKRCPQIQDNEYVGNINCLTLSIFKPRIAENASVFFYIHGDDFKTGSGDPSIYGPDYLVSNKIILVLPNYRLGPLGFLCMKNKTAPGNMALKDLTLALSWIHDNIHFFGGNPDNIVVSGDGRSGALAELLALSPMSKDHVDKVISESGSLLSHWALDRDPDSTVADFFDRIQEAEKSIEFRIDMSLGNLDLSTILKAVNDIEFKPCIEAKDDNVFMTETPYAMITNNKIETKFLMGSAMYAGLQEALHHTQDSISELNEDFTLLLPNDLKFATSTLKAEIGDSVKRQYFGDHDITLANVQSISLYYTDVGYLSPGIRSARLLAKAGATVYFYEFSFVGEFNRERESLNSPVQGAARGDIVRYLFTQDGHVPDEDTDETKMVATLTEMWTNFMKEGHPETETIEWKKLENENHNEEEWLLIDSDQPRMQKGLHVDRLPLWTNIYEEHFIEEYFIDEPNEDLIVTTNSGKVQGFLWQNKEDIISYIDIPYGTVNTKPFEAATPAEPWDVHGVRDHDKRCPQIQDNEYVGNINCLTLSIFKPRIAENASVFFYIHGDDFKTGSGDPSIYGPDYLVSNKIILVLPNYRLGPLGFLCMKNKTAPGNMALKDLTLALSWIHDNIILFGGNPDNIVVSGDGRSGALAELLALSPMSKDHVDKVISESGSLLSHWALDRDPESTVADFFDRIQEAENSIQSRIDMSLEDLDLSTILKAVIDIEFKPCIEEKDDDVFMTETPYAMITKYNIETTFLMGSAMYAGFQEALHHTQDSISELNEDFTLLLPNDLKFSTSTLKAEIGDSVKRQYFGDQNITLNNLQNISLYYTDVGYLSPGIRSARHLARAGATVYFYEFSFLGEFNRELDSLNSPVQGAVRGDIVRYLFTQDGHVPDEDTDETKMVATLTEMWTNFLTKGHPATETIEWNKLENENHNEEEWLLIDSDQPSMQKGLHVDRLTLWTNIYRNHFIDNHAQGLTPAVLTVLMFQLVFWLVFCTNVSRVF